MTEPATPVWTFLSHTLEQVGPPVFLLNLLRWLHAHEDVRLEVVSLEGGALADAFREVAGVTIVGDPGQPSETDRTGTTTPPPDPEARRALHAIGPAALVYVNSSSSVRALPWLVPSDAPVIAHVHELEVGLTFHLDPHERERFLHDSTGVIAASRAVAENLVARHQVDPERIVVHHELIALADGTEHRSADEIRAELGVPDGAALIGTAAVVNWRKGTDLFIQLALRLHRLRPDLDAHFVWIGGRPDEPDTMRFCADVATAGLDGRLHVTPFVDHPLDWMRAFDVFALPSREDAFPLACLEAASVDVPIVCFASGGMPELVEDDAGVVVPYADVDAMVGAIAELLDDPARRARLGRTAAAKVRARHDIERGAPALVADLHRWADRP